MTDVTRDPLGRGTRGFGGQEAVQAPSGSGSPRAEPQFGGRPASSSGAATAFQVGPPTINLPKGGGAIRGIGETFTANPVTGTASMSVPIATSPGRSAFGPQLALSYDSGAGNGPFGFGWQLAIPAIRRSTDKAIPRYLDSAESDVYVLSGSEDLVPALVQDTAGAWVREGQTRTLDGLDFQVERYRPRVEGLFARIERWTRVADGDIHWRSISRDNVTAWYGKSADSRIADPADPRRVFSWLLCETYDDKGNAAVYEYVAEDSSGVDLSAASERNRTPTIRSANRYLKRIKYGNTISRLIQPDLTTMSWLFEVVFDYAGDGTDLSPGQHVAAADPDAEEFVFASASLADAVVWDARPDMFSSYRAAFEVRTYRLCRRVLMFHHFPAELGTDDYLVRSTDFEYRQTPVATVLMSVTQSGYIRRPEFGPAIRYLKRSMPPVEFTYSDVAIDPTVHALDPESLAGLPEGVAGPYKWIDLDGDGVGGVLTEQGNAWFFKRNTSQLFVERRNGVDRASAHFGPLEAVGERPAVTLAAGGQLMDLAGDGRPDLVVLGGPAPGLYQREEEGGWAPYRTFASRPAFDPADPNLRFLDLDGDGHADALITGDEALTWHTSLAEDGFGPERRVPLATDDERGPRLVFADGSDSIHLADMTGDGSTDLVRIKNGGVSYWPNLGYGRFGTRVAMDGAPVFDTADEFDADRIRLLDIDGSGTTDIVYVGAAGVTLHFNQAGNSWGEPVHLGTFPRIDEVASVGAFDLLGNGTGCLVWSSPLVGSSGRAFRYVDLMGGQKPHLLLKIENNLGAETHIRYAPSTRFFLRDWQAGRPWITRLPFPVQVVERIDTYDRISRNHFATRYAYHHGFFDGVDREFRGFGMVEQWDTEVFAALSGSDEFPNAENLDEASHVPPVLTKTWFHTGAFVDGGRIWRRFEGEYYRLPGLTDDEFRAMLMDSELPPGLTAEETREACRAMSGSMLRQEVFGLDRSVHQEVPYTVNVQRLRARVVQVKAGNRHSVIYGDAADTVVWHLERLTTEPRIQHSLYLEADAFGTPTTEATVAYGRRVSDPILAPADQDRQQRSYVVFVNRVMTNAVDDADAYRVPSIADERSYELTGYDASGPSGLFNHHDLVTNSGNQILLTFDTELGYDEAPTTGRQRRLIEASRRLFRPDDLGVSQGDQLHLLPLGSLESRAVAGENFRLAFTTPYVAGQLTRDGAPLVSSLENILAAAGSEGAAYVAAETLAAAGTFPSTDPVDEWWVSSGRSFLSGDAGDSPATELSHAMSHFFVTRRTRDPFHTTAQSTEHLLTYDSFDLVQVQTRDPAGNLISAGERLPNGSLDPSRSGMDYRVLQPVCLTDPNGNRGRVAFDALGLLVASATMGKRGQVEGDSLDGVVVDLPIAQTVGHFADPLVNPAAILGSATSRFVHDVHAYLRSKYHPLPTPPRVATISRETHVSDLAVGTASRLRHVVSYSDGAGHAIQKKIQAEAGPIPRVDAAGKVLIGPDGEPILTSESHVRWVGSGWTIVDNKAKPVRQFEPFFSGTHEFERDVRLGHGPVLLYDPVARHVATLHANHTWQKVVYQPWRQEAWDAADTVDVDDPRVDPHVGGVLSRLPATLYSPSWRSLRTDPAFAAEAVQRWPDAEIRDAERRAAEKSTVHARTPTTSYSDALGRPFLSLVPIVAAYTDGSPPSSSVVETRTDTDVEGNVRTVRDSLGRQVVRYDYDLLGRPLHQTSLDAGERWQLPSATGDELYVWNSQGHRIRTTHDVVRRTTSRRLRIDAAPEMLIEQTTYGEGHPNDTQANLRGRVLEVRDQAGLVTTDLYDFKGNVLRHSRRLAVEYKTTIDWTGPIALEGESFESRIWYDAQDRPTQLVAPHSSQPGSAVNITRPTYNEANLLESIDIWLNHGPMPVGLIGTGGATLSPVTAIDYDPKGRRTYIAYGNGAVTQYRYDPTSHRLESLVTRRNAIAFPDDCPGQEPEGWPGCAIQNLSYTYDAIGGLTAVRDRSQQRVFFGNVRVDPVCEFTYDAAYRLIEARGREHLGQNGSPAPNTYNDAGRAPVLHPGDGQAMGRYTERYRYDEIGNLQSMEHRGSNPASPGWTRDFTYNEASLEAVGVITNRLTSTTTGATSEVYSVAGNGYDGVGNLLGMPHLQALTWDYAGQLASSSRQAVNATDDDGIASAGEVTYYRYDMSGQRVRKVTDLPGGQLKEERLFLGGFERYRRVGFDALTRETLHVMDDRQRVAVIETRTAGNEPGEPTTRVRYQLGNHLGSTAIELDALADIISYEEYTPYGSSAYRAVRRHGEARRRYRYTGKERDEETGFYYHGARYYAPWLGRWISPDPSGIGDGLSLYAYVRGSPMVLVDPTGCEGQPNPLDYANFEDYSDAMHNYLPMFREGYPEELWTQARDSADSQVTAVSREVRTGPSPEEQQAREDMRRFQAIRPPLLSFIMPSAVAPYLRDQSAGIHNPYLRSQAQFNQRGAEAVARFTNRLGMVTVAAYGAGMALAAGGVVAVELAGPAVLAGGARLAAAYESAGIWIGATYPGATAFGTAVAAGLSGTSLPGGGGGAAPQAAGQVAQGAGRSVWSLNAFLRGRIIERILGQRLSGQFMRAPNFPAIDKFVAGAGNVAQEVISIKSIDLNAASYRVGNAVLNRVTSYINSLANFSTATRSGQTVIAGPTTRRILEIAIPASGATPQQLQQLGIAAQNAQARGITLSISVIQ